MRALLVALWCVALLAGSAGAQPKKLTLGIYAPSVELGAATARLAYVRALASAIQQSAGVPVEAQSYANLGALVKANVDLAIVDGPCVATNPGWKVLATASVGGGATRGWALFSNAGSDMQALRGKKLAYVASGCNDAGFIDHAMLESEVDAAFFGARVGKQDLTAAIAEVASYRTAQAVFAPAASGKGLTKVFDTGVVPNPALVALSKLPAPTLDKITAAVIGYGGGGVIVGWLKPSREIYSAFAARLGRVTKAPVLAPPEATRLELKDILLDLPSLREPALVPVRHHFVRPATRLD